MNAGMLELDRPLTPHHVKYRTTGTDWHWGITFHCGKHFWEGPFPNHDQACTDAFRFSVERPLNIGALELTNLQLGILAHIASRPLDQHFVIRGGPATPNNPYTPPEVLQALDQLTELCFTTVRSCGDLSGTLIKTTREARRWFVELLPFCLPAPVPLGQGAPTFGHPHYDRAENQIAMMMRNHDSVQFSKTQAACTYGKNYQLLFEKMEGKQIIGTQYNDDLGLVRLHLYAPQGVRLRDEILKNHNPV